MTDLLKLKQRMKEKKPHFTRSDSNKKKRISKGGWRRPNGLHSKMRLGHFGFKKTVSIGYKTPDAVRGLEKNGMKKVVVRSLNDFDKLNPKENLAVIANVGMKKKIEIIKEAQKRKISIFNVKDPAKFLESVGIILSERKERRKKISEKKAEAKKEKAKEKKEEKKEEKEISEEEKLKQEKQEKDKLIIKRS